MSELDAHLKRAVVAAKEMEARITQLEAEARQAQSERDKSTRRWKAHCDDLRSQIPEALRRPPKPYPKSRKGLFNRAGRGTEAK